MNPSTFQYLRARGCRPRARCRAARARTIGQERRGRWPLDNASLLFLVWCAAAGYSVTAGTITGAVQIVTRNKTVLARPTIMADEDRAVFSPDARHVAYPVGSRVQRVCLDGVEGKGYDVVTNLTFSPDGKRLAYWAITRTHVLVVVDGKEVKAPALIGTSDQLLFSPDCRH